MSIYANYCSTIMLLRQLVEAGYHIVFAPKYSRKVIYKQIRKDIGEIFRKLCNEMKVEIIEAEACMI